MRASVLSLLTACLMLYPQQVASEPLPRAELNLPFSTPSLALQKESPAAPSSAQHQSAGPDIAPRDTSYKPMILAAPGNAVWSVKNGCAVDHLLRCPKTRIRRGTRTILRNPRRENLPNE
ncbi:MAG: hypothetical protein Q9185_006243 [Variospora sp. 1 TL-2023]